MKNIVFENVVKSYGKNVIVKNLNIEIKEGERLILLGPSGCGKSTTLRMIAGLEDITEGNLYLGGKLANNIPSGKRNVSMVFQNYALFPHMTVSENITYSLRIHKMDKNEIEERLYSVIEILDLKGLENRKPKDLSGGQRQRVALARAVVARSDFFLLDEPLSNLDAQLRGKARKELVRLHEIYGQTMVYVTHDQVEAMTVGNRIALINKGELQMLDTPDNVYNNPANVFTAKFIGSPSTNILEAYYDGNGLTIGEQTVVLSDEWKEILDRTGKNRFYFGVRPEQMKLKKTSINNSLKCTVKYVENYGNKKGIYISLNGIEVIVVADKSNFKEGDTVYYCPDYNKIHIFDYDTEKSIGYPESVIDAKEKDKYIGD